MKPFTPNRLWLFPILFLILSVIDAFVAAAQPHDKPKYYTDIPGVTREEVDAIEKLKRLLPEGLSYAMLPSEIAFFNAHGDLDGFTRFFCHEMSELLGIPITPKLVDWKTLFTGLDNHVFDLSGELTSTPDRREKCRMTAPVAERELIVSHHATRDDFDLINGRERLRYGFLTGSATYNRVLESSQGPFSPAYFEDVHGAIEAIRIGVIDAFISEGSMAIVSEDFSNMVEQKYYPLSCIPVSLATSNPDVFAVIDVVQKYLDNGGRERLAAMIAKGGLEYLRHKFLKQLNAEEMTFVADRVRNGAAIPIVAEYDGYPVSFHCKHEKRWRE